MRYSNISVRGRRWVHKSIIAALLTLIPVSAFNIASAKTCYVSRMQIHNDGGYVMGAFELETTNEGPYALRDNPISIGQSYTADLTAFGPQTQDDIKGHEIWLRYEIYAGESRSCRKDSTKLRFHKNGNTWKFQGKGSTTSGNRCRFKGDNKCLSYEDVTK